MNENHLMLRSSDNVVGWSPQGKIRLYLTIHRGSNLELLARQVESEV